MAKVYTSKKISDREWLISTDDSTHADDEFVIQAADGTFVKVPVALPGGAAVSNAPAWAPTTAYKQGQLVSNGGNVYAALVDFTSGSTFNANNWLQVGVKSGTYVQPIALVNQLAGGFDETDQQLLAKALYTPVSAGIAGSNSTTPATLNSILSISDLQVYFVAPPSGAVRITLEGFAQVLTPGNYVVWSLKDGYTGAVVASSALIARASTIPPALTDSSGGTSGGNTIAAIGASANDAAAPDLTATKNAIATLAAKINAFAPIHEGHYAYTFTLTGLTPGQAYNYLWAMSSFTGGQTVHTVVGGSEGQAAMRVVAVPTRTAQRSVLGGTIYEVSDTVNTVTADGNFNAVPSILKCPDGSILTAYRKAIPGGPAYTSVYTRRAASAAAALANTWGAEVQVLYDGVGDYGTAILCGPFSNGQIALVTWYKPTPPSNANAVSQVLFSSDSGHTWGAPVTLPSVYTYQNFCESQLVEAFGAYWLAIWGNNIGDASNRCRVSMVKSTNHGATWTTGTEIANGIADSAFYNETGLRLDATSGKLVANVRQDSLPGNHTNFLQDTSADGVTWSGLAAYWSDISAGQRFLTMDDGRIGSIGRMATLFGPSGLFIQLPTGIQNATAPLGYVKVQDNLDVMQYGGLVEISANEYLCLYSQQEPTGGIADIVSVPVTVYPGS